MPRFARCVFAIFLAVSCLTSSLTCQAAVPETAAAAFILMEAGSGRVLASRNETQERSVASTTKIMTCLVALEHSELTEQVTVKREHLREGSSMYLLEGETLTMEELLYGLMLPSGNDAAECIAAHCGGSGGSAQFVRWMNEKAKALGMEHTSFANPSGLDEMGHSSCALDMARLAAYAMQNPTFARIVSTRTASVGTRTMTNHNKLLASYSGCVGLKTGYTGDAGRTLVTCAERGGMRLVAVTLYDGSDWADHTALYDYGFAVCRRIRGLTDAPILFLTARTDEASVLEGLGIGADDYLAKPFRVAELRARVAAHLRRQNRTPVHRLVRGGVSFDLSAREAAVGETPLPLTRSEYAICEYLVLHAGQTFTKEQIYEAVFGIDGTADDTAITQHIKNIRAKLRAAGVPEPETLLKTIWGVGYQWKNEG